MRKQGCMSSSKESMAAQGIELGHRGHVEVDWGKDGFENVMCSLGKKDQRT